MGLAYRMLGSLSEAEDAVQETWLRWRDADQCAIGNMRAYLARIVMRVCLDVLKSARLRRESYVGPWLPEPVLDAAHLAAETASDYAHDLSVGLLLALERLSPLERAAFLLHDVFDVDFAEIATLLGRTEATCRQLAARARANVRAARPRSEMPADGGVSIARAFAAAARSGDVSDLARLLARDASLRTDGGGKARAARNVVVGRDRVARFFVGVARKFGTPAVTDTRFVPINGLPGIITHYSDGSLSTTALQIEDGLIAAIYVVRNPEKLMHLGLADRSQHSAPQPRSRRGHIPEHATRRP